MSTIEFQKYQGTGNDFVMIDDRQEVFDLDDHHLVAQLCDRKFGIGADGLIIVRNHGSADFKMVYYNSDGHLTSLCGNGSRCAVKFAQTLGLVEGPCSFETSEGILNANIVGELVHIQMPDVHKIETFEDHYFLNTGSPHHICKVADVEQYDVYNEGKKIRYGAPYHETGSNVNFMEPKGSSQIFVRTYERGVEDETLSCGTGVTAAALVQGLLGESSPINVQTLGGHLQISFEKENGGFKNVFLIGPAEKVFAGSITL